MRVLGRNRLGASGTATPDEQAWLSLTMAAIWLGATDVKKTHPMATNPGANQWKFPLPGDGTTITTLISFASGDVSIQSVE